MAETRTPYQETNGSKKEDVFEIGVKEKASFVTTLEESHMTSKKLTKYVNILFSAYQDFEGAAVNAIPGADQRNCTVLLQFNILSNYDDTKPYAFCPIDKDKGDGSISERFNRITTMSSSISKTITMTKWGKEGLRPYMIPTGGRKDDINWQNMYKISVINNKAVIFLTGLDIIRILKEIFGSRDELGMIDYKVDALKPLAVAGGANSYQNWMMKISRCKEAPVSALAEELGYMGASSPIVRKDEPMDRLY